MEPENGLHVFFVNWADGSEAIKEKESNIYFLEVK
jgi:hypothetical protein